MDFEQEIDKQYLNHLKQFKPKRILEELLAHIHGDGGHYTFKHGLAQSTFDAMKKYTDNLKDKNYDKQ